MEATTWRYLGMIISPAIFVGKEIRRSEMLLKDVLGFSNITKMITFVIGALVCSKFIDMTSTPNYLCIQVSLWVFDIARQTIFHRHKYSSYFKAVELFLVILSLTSFCQVIFLSGEPRYQNQVRKKVNTYTHPHVPGNFRRSSKHQEL